MAGLPGVVTPDYWTISYLNSPTEAGNNYWQESAYASVEFFMGNADADTEKLSWKNNSGSRSLRGPALTVSFQRQNLNRVEHRIGTAIPMACDAH